MEFIAPDDVRKEFFSHYISDDNYTLERWKSDITKYYPSFFEKDDDLRKFLNV